MGADMPQYGLLGSILSVQYVSQQELCSNYGSLRQLYDRPETFVAMGPMDKRLYLNTVS